MFALKTFVILTYLLICDDLFDIETIVIDQEYTGHERIIKHMLLQMMRRHVGAVAKDTVDFRFIGKKHPAHVRALAVFRKKIIPDVIVTSKDALPHIL